MGLGSPAHGLGSYLAYQRAALPPLFQKWPLFSCGGWTGQITEQQKNVKSY
jgi:hypothetical protein